MNVKVIWFLILVLILGAANGCSKQEPSVPPLVEGQVSVLPGPDGLFTVLWRLEPQTGWHLYSPHRNDSGFPPALKITWPAGWVAEDLQWPVAERYLMEGGILDHVYHGPVTLVQEVQVPETAPKDAPVHLQASWDWLVCQDECVPGQTALDVVFFEDIPSDKGFQEWEQAKNFLPVPATNDGWKATWSKGRVALHVPGASHLEFHPNQDSVRIRDLVADGAVAGNTLELDLREGPKGYGPLRGVLKIQTTDGQQVIWSIDLPYGG